MSTTTHPPAPAKPGAYEVSRPGGKCAVSGLTIEPGHKFFTALQDTPEGLRRVDVLPEFWDSFEKSSLLGFWQTTMPRPEAKKKIFVDDAVLTELFERLGEAAEDAKLNFRFVLGLILMRKRILAYEGTRNEEGKEIWSMKLKGRERPLDMLNPHLGEEQVADVSRQLTEILNE
jgi:hypothetical protein